MPGNSFRPACGLDGTSSNLQRLSSSQSPPSTDCKTRDRRSRSVIRRRRFRASRSPASARRAGCLQSSASRKPNGGLYSRTSRPHGLGEGSSASNHALAATTRPATDAKYRPTGASRSGNAPGDALGDLLLCFRNTSTPPRRARPWLEVSHCARSPNWR